MRSSVISMVLMCSVIYLKSADCAVETPCYELDLQSWTCIRYELLSNSNSLCKNLCKQADANYRYYGTYNNQCCCRLTELSTSDKRRDGKCNIPCLGEPLEKCGGNYGSHKLINLDEINRSPYTSTSEVTQTSISTALTMTVTQRSTGMRPRKLLCKCPKRLINTKWHFLDGKNITDAEVKKMILEDFNKNIKSEISVDKKTVSKELRKKNSSVNKRKSSQSIGWGCIVLLILPVVFLIAIDILNCCIHYQSRLGDRKRNRIGPTSDIPDLRNSSQPLQENANITESYYDIRCGNDVHPDEVKLETDQRRRDDNNEEDRDKCLQYM